MLTCKSHIQYTVHEVNETLYFLMDGVQEWGNKKAPAWEGAFSLELVRQSINMLKRATCMQHSRIEYRPERNVDLLNLVIDSYRDWAIKKARQFSERAFLLVSVRRAIGNGKAI